MKKYANVIGGIVKIPRNYVYQVRKSEYDGNAKLAELVVDMTDPAIPLLFIGNATGNLTSAATGTVQWANAVNAIFDNATVTNLTVTELADFGNASNVYLGNISNIHIDGGSNLQVLTTNGNGNLTWTFKAGIGDIKQSFVLDDHDGWFKMDGRSIFALGLTATQSAAASSLGLTNLPDATDRVLKQKPSEAIGSTGGISNITISATNLPSGSLGTTSAAGDHVHEWPYPSNSTGGYVGIFDPNNGNVYYRGSVGDLFTQSAGFHTHSVSITGGNATPIDVENSYLVVNAFIFLGS